MSLAAITVNWSYVPGSLGTKVEYKKASDSIWLQPSVPFNPTTNNFYPLSIEEDTVYDVKLTTLGPCSSRSTTTQFIKPSNTHCCPSGYSLSGDATYCQKTSVVAATPPSDPQTTVAVQQDNYSICGSYIYSSFSINGTGSSTIIPTSNLWWVNVTGNCFVVGDLVSGPLNRCALWANVTPVEFQEVGVSYCITVPENKTYYVGVGVDNIGIIRIDGNTVLQQDPAALDAQYGLTGGRSTFSVFHIYPIPFTAGTHVIEIVGQNSAGLGVNPAAFGAEIYDNTAAELIAATSYSDLNLLFSTKDHIGEPVQLGSDGIGYSCPIGYSLVLCDGPAYCKQVLTTPLIEC